MKVDQIQQNNTMTIIQFDYKDSIVLELFKLQTSDRCGGGSLISKANDGSRHLNNHNPKTPSSGYLKYQIQRTVSSLYVKNLKERQLYV